MYIHIRAYMDARSRPDLHVQWLSCPENQYGDRETTGERERERVREREGEKKDRGHEHKKKMRFGALSLKCLKALFWSHRALIVSAK